MKAPKILSIAMLAVGISVLGITTPAMAADGYGGSGSPFSLVTYNYYRTGFLPSPPSSVPASSTITAVNYNFDWTSSGYSRGSMSAIICSTSTNCTDASQFNNSTTFFDGLPATTSLYFRAAWKDPFMTGTISGGPIDITTSIVVSYN